MNKYQIIGILFFVLYGNIFAQEKDNSVTLLFVGDIMGHGPQVRAAYNPITKTYNYDACFQYMSPIFVQADYVIGNLEVTLGTKPYRGYPQFSSPVELAIATKKAGINILATANNHSCDRRKKGIDKTISVLDSLQIMHLGTYNSTLAKDSINPLIIEKNHIKIALLNYTYGTNGIPVPKGSVVNLLKKETIAADVIKAKSYHPDQIIAFVHWGEQYRDRPVQSQKKWFAYFKSLGVNIVIGSHPHVIEPMEWDKEQNTLVVYSLGNFVSNQRSFPRDGAGIFELTLTKKEQQTFINQANYQLTWVYKRKQDKKTDYLILPIDEFAYKKTFFTKDSDYQKMKKYALHAKKLLGKYNRNIPEKTPYTDLFIHLHNILY
jgi:poly-gamma-glutamate synthesis protein (capsule biosynthesis protein)